MLSWCKAGSAAAAVDSGFRRPAAAGAMPCRDVRKAEVAYPTGDPKFAVMQPFPAAVSAEEADPFLMCDEIGPMESKGKETDPDRFPVGWHPHIGMDIMSYFKQGTGRHADSLGNRNEFRSPGFQWCSVGSGIEHAEGGGTPAGEPGHGFQIWVNVPQARKRDDPRYGTEPPENIPLLEFPGATMRLLAGGHGDARGPFQTVQSVQMADFELQAGAELTHPLPADLDCCLLYVYRGAGTVGGRSIAAQHIAIVDASDPSVRDLALAAGTNGMGALLFAGRRIRERICWRGPFVMSSRDELQRAFAQFQSGDFPPKRVPWDYKRFAARPAHLK